MPRKPTKARRIRPGLTGRQIEHLIHGFCLAINCGYENIHYPFQNEDHRKQIWIENREYLLSLEGAGKIPGVFGELRKGEKPTALKDYERPGNRIKTKKEEATTDESERKGGTGKS